MLELEIYVELPGYCDQIGLLFSITFPGGKNHHRYIVVAVPTTGTGGSLWTKVLVLRYL